METVKLIIDNKQIEVPKGTSILNAARANGIHIPTLCYLNLDLLHIENKPGSCRICVVEVEKRRNLAPACATECMDGMVVKTNSMRVLEARRIVMELLLSDHPADCLTCLKSGHCELQSMAAELGIRKITYKGEQSQYRTDKTSPSIVRLPDKCIMCRRCEMMCNEVQTVGVLSAINRGFSAVVGTEFEEELRKTHCTFCGQCVAVCPTAALIEVDNTARLIQDLNDPNKTVIVQTAPSVRVALGEEFGMPYGTIVTGKMATALRRLGFDYVFDTDFGADMTIMEEGTELLQRLTAYLAGDKSVKIPIMTSCCPAWVNFFEHFYPEYRQYPSTARSPQSMFGPVAKTYFADKIKVNRKDLVVVSIMPCIAKKFENQRSEYTVDGDPNVNYALTTRELARLIKYANIDFASLEDSDFDSPMGESTGASVIFGATGGVIEAAVRTAYELHTGNKLPRIDFEELRGLEGIRQATIDFDGVPVKIGIAHELGNARKLMEMLKRGECEFHAIEVMACPGGCIGGAGQPYHHGKSEVIKARFDAIYREDKNKPIRKSHENPDLIKLYKDFLGEPGGELAHHLLHTEFYDKSGKSVNIE